MGVVAMLVKWSGYYIWNFITVGPVVSEKSFKIVDGRRTDDAACLY